MSQNPSLASASPAAESIRPAATATSDPIRIDGPEPASSSPRTSPFSPESPSASDPPKPRRPIALRILTGLAVGYTLYFAGAILFPILLAMVLALLLRPVVRALARLRIPEVAGAGIVLAAATATIVIGGYRLSIPATEWISTLPRHLENIEWKLDSLRSPFDNIREASKKVEKMTDGEDFEAVPVKMEKAPTLPSTLLNITTGLIAGIVVTGMLLYFLLATGDGMLHRAVHLAPAYRDRQNLFSLLKDIERVISGYLITFTLINIGLGTAIGTAMWLIGLPNPVLWGVMAGCLNFVPYAGAFVGAAVVFLVGVLSFDSIGYAAIAPAAYGGINLLEGCIITPLILGRSMKLDPIAIVLSLLFWGWIWGIGGALLAVPLLAITKIACDHFESLRPLGNLLGGGGR
ncbi:MAG: AI-2E family transporter [Planctomycetaceae bacterium]